MLKTTEYNTQLSNIEIPMIIDEISSIEFYVGTSINGYDTYLPTWKIKKMWKIDNMWHINYPYGKQDYNYVWNDRYDYSYSS